MGITIYQVDAFTDRPFKGNPAAVCLLDQPREAKWIANSQEYDFVSRFFAPAVGVNEDPVTGSAHCRLTPYWQAKLKQNEFIAYQASERGGFLQLALDGDRVRIGGKAVTVLKGQLSE